MDFIWTPWRYRYIAEHVPNRDPNSCVFCDALAAGDDAAVYILFRGEKNFIILNRFPYTPGHCMVIPYVHGGTLDTLDLDTMNEMMALTRRTQVALESVYHPEGYNMGMNIGR